jgi:hypothetical protein
VTAPIAPGTDSPVTATRVMKARRTSTCPACHGPILAGQQIAKAGTWQHIEHVIERQRGAQSVP